LKGSQLRSVEVEAYTRGSAPRLVDEYIYHDVIVTRLHNTDVNDNKVGLSYAEFTHAHQNYNAAGVATTWSSGGFDLVSNVQIVAPVPVADVLWV